MLVTEKRDPNNPDSISFEQRAADLQVEAEAKAKAEKRAKGSPFSRWTQYNNDHTKELMMLAIKYPKAHAILYFLVDQMDQYNACICSYRVLEEVLGCGQATIARSLKVLKDLGFIAILKSGSANIYTVNDKVYWKSWGNNIPYSKFPANVVLSMNEQDPDCVNFDNIKQSKTKVVTNKSK